MNLAGTARLLFETLKLEGHVAGQAIALSEDAYKTIGASLDELTQAVAEINVAADLPGFIREVTVRIHGKLYRSVGGFKFIKARQRGYGRFDAPL